MNLLKTEDLLEKLEEKYARQKIELKKATTQLNKMELRCQTWTDHFSKVVIEYKAKIFQNVYKYLNILGFFSHFQNVPADIKEIIECLLGSRNGKQYSDAVRIFCLTLRFYSPRAYECVRHKFSDNLPHDATIRKWYQRSCGINEDPM